MSELTHVLASLDRGERGAAEQLLPLVYNELRLLAARRLANERPGHTLQATALVHETYLRLVGPDGMSSGWDGRNHFFGAAAEAMRRILIESARRRDAAKRGGGRPALSLNHVDVVHAVGGVSPDELLALDEALARLANEDPVKAELVKLRYFAGLTVAEAAAALGISRATADRYWDYARSWLFAELQDAPGRPNDEILART
jgi:RNA polymerase sigma factor (TIGR02999 family)